MWGPRRCVCSMSRQDFGQIYSSKYIFHSKSHYPVSRLRHLATTNEEKVNWSFSKFVITSREHTWCENVRIVCKSLPKSEQNDIFWGSGWLKFTPGTLIPVKRGVIESGSSYNPVPMCLKKVKAVFWLKFCWIFP